MINPDKKNQVLVIKQILIDFSDGFSDKIFLNLFETQLFNGLKLHFYPLEAQVIFLKFLKFEHPNLEILDVSHNVLSLDAINELTSLLKKNIHIHTLILVKTHLGKKGIQALMHTLPTHILNVDISCNGVSSLTLNEKEVTELSDIIMHNQLLTVYYNNDDSRKNEVIIQLENAFKYKLCYLGWLLGQIFSTFHFPNDMLVNICTLLNSTAQHKFILNGWRSVQRSHSNMAKEKSLEDILNNKCR